MTNPYQPPLVPRKRLSVDVRFVMPSTILLVVAIAIAFDLPRAIGSYLRDGYPQSAIDAVTTCLVLSVAIFCFVIEFFGSSKLRRLVPWTLSPIVLITAVIVHNTWWFGIKDVFQRVFVDPTPFLGWLLCPVTWYYFVVAFHARGHEGE